MSRYKSKLKRVIAQQGKATLAKLGDTKPDWSRKCESCGAVPIVPATGMCGPCTFGEADTAGGNW